MTLMPVFEVIGLQYVGLLKSVSVNTKFNHKNLACETFSQKQYFLHVKMDKILRNDTSVDL